MAQGGRRRPAGLHVTAGRRRTRCRSTRPRACNPSPRGYGRRRRSTDWQLPPADATGATWRICTPASRLAALLNAPARSGEQTGRGGVRCHPAHRRPPEHRQAEGFKGRWRKCLQTANLLQFLPSFEWLSAEAIEVHRLRAAPSRPAAKPARQTPLEELLIYCDARCHDLFRRSLAEAAPVPEIGFELQDSQGRVCAEAELAWPRQEDSRGAARADGGSTEVFRERGWSVFEPTDLSLTRLPC